MTTPDCPASISDLIPTQRSYFTDKDMDDRDDDSDPAPAEGGQGPADQAEQGG